MVRLKFLVFALLALLLWVAHLSQVSSAVMSPAVEQGSAHARAVAEAVRAAVSEARTPLSETALAVTTSSRFAQVGRAPAADRAVQLAAVANAVAPEALRPQVIVAAGTESSVTFARADGEQIEALEAAILMAAPGKDVFDVAGVPHAFVSFPLVVAADGKATALGALGLPLTVQLEQVVKATGAQGAAVVFGKRVLAKAGQVADAALAIPAGEARVIERGTVSNSMGTSLPLFAGDDGAPLTLAARTAIEGTPFEAVAVTSVAPAARALAGYQSFALPATLGLLGLTIVFAFLMGGRKASSETAPEAEAPVAPAPAAEAAPEPAAAFEAAPDEPASSEAFAAAPVEAQSGEEQLEQLEPMPAGDDRLPEAAPPAAAFGGGEFPFPTQDEPQYPSTSPATVEAPVNPGAYAFDEPATRAYPPSAAAEPESYEPGGPEPEATRVAMIPQHLIDASARATHTALGLQAPASFAPPPPAVAPTVAPAIPAAKNDEERHFQDVYREFLSTREKSGEGNDGLTYDKFVQKLRKNKEQLVQKYACKTVRFQVYMKEGKAALKATPVRE